MPRKSRLVSPVEHSTAPGGAAAVDRALSLLAAFRNGEPDLGLPELAERTGLYKSTVLRLLASLQHARLVRRLPNGRYGVGPEAARLYSLYAASFSLEDAVMPALRALVAATGESAAFHVRQGEHRLCLYRVDSPQPIRDHVRVGDLLPLDKGAGGHVLLAYSGEQGDLYAQIRHEQCAMLVGDRAPDMAGISVPVFRFPAELAGALTLTMPAHRFDPQFRERVVQAGRDITAELGGRYPGAAVAGE